MCVGIETIVHDSRLHIYKSNIPDCITSRRLVASRQSLSETSKMLRSVSNTLQSYEELKIEEKYTSDIEILIGLTIDYRHLENWRSFKENKEPMIREAIQRSIKENLKSNSSFQDHPFIQTYSSHPFLDLYGIRCDKGLAFDNILLRLGGKESADIIYL